MKKLILSLAILSFISALQAQSLLWKVSGKDLQSPSYVYGTIHIQDARVFSFDTTVVYGAMAACDAFAMEILLDEIDPREMRNAMYMPKGKVLSKMMSKEDFAILDSICKKEVGVTAYMLNTMKPFFLSSAISQSKLAKDQEDALDLFFLKRSRANGKSCYGVEEYSTQIDAIDAIKLKEQVKMLVESLHANKADDTTSTSTEFDELLQAYLSFNFEKMLELSNDPSMPKKFNKVFLIDRNVGMADNFVKIARGQSLFCAVGAAHLAGEKGVLSLLRKKGYTVEPVLFEWRSETESSSR